jgi:hypothetical protein
MELYMLLREFFDALEGDSSAKSKTTSSTTAIKQNTSAKVNPMVAETNKVTTKKVTSIIKR